MSVSAVSKFQTVLRQKGGNFAQALEKMIQQGVFKNATEIAELKAAGLIDEAQAAKLMPAEKFKAPEAKPTGGKGTVEDLKGQIKNIPDTADRRGEAVRMANDLRASGNNSIQATKELKAAYPDFDDASIADIIKNAKNPNAVKAAEEKATKKAKKEVPPMLKRPEKNTSPLDAADPTRADKPQEYVDGVMKNPQYANWLSSIKSKEAEAKRLTELAKTTPKGSPQRQAAQEARIAAEMESPARGKTTVAAQYKTDVDKLIDGIEPAPERPMQLPEESVNLSDLEAPAPAPSKPGVAAKELTGAPPPKTEQPVETFSEPAPAESAPAMTDAEIRELTMGRPGAEAPAMNAVQVPNYKDGKVGRGPGRLEQPAVPWFDQPNMLMPYDPKRTQWNRSMGKEQAPAGIPAAGQRSTNIFGEVAPEDAAQMQKENAFMDKNATTDEWGRGYDPERPAPGSGVVPYGQTAVEPGQGFTMNGDPYAKDFTIEGAPYDMSRAEFLTEATPLRAGGDARVVSQTADSMSALPPSSASKATAPGSQGEAQPGQAWQQASGTAPGTQGKTAAPSGVPPMLARPRGAAEPETEIFGTPPKGRGPQNFYGDLYDVPPARRNPTGMSNTQKGVAIGVGTAGAILTGDTRVPAGSTKMDGGFAKPNAAMVNAPGGAPIKTGAAPQGEAIQTFDSSQESTNPNAAKVDAMGQASGATGMDGKVPPPKIDTKTHQEAAQAATTLPAVTAEIDKKMPGWGDTMNAALKANVSAYEKLTGELNASMKETTDAHQKEMFNTRMAEAFTNFAQSLVQYAAASEGVRKQLNISDYYKSSPADFTRLFESIDADFKAKTDAIRDSVKQAQANIAASKKDLTTAVRDEQKFGREKEMEGIKSGNARTLELDKQRNAIEGQMAQLEAKAKYDAEAAAKYADLQRELARIHGEYSVEGQKARGAASAAELNNAFKSNQTAAIPANMSLAEQEMNIGKMRSINDAFNAAMKPGLNQEKQISALQDVAARLGVRPQIIPGRMPFGWTDSVDKQKLIADIQAELQKQQSSGVFQQNAKPASDVMKQNLKLLSGSEVRAMVPEAALSKVPVGGFLISPDGKTKLTRTVNGFTSEDYHGK